MRVRRRGLAVPQANGGCADFLRVGQQAFAIERGRGAAHHEAVRHAAGSECTAPEIAHFHGAVHELVVIGRTVQAKARGIDLHGGERRGQAPVGRGGRALHLERVRGRLLPHDAQAQAGAVEKAARRVQPGRAHRRVVGADLVAQRKRRAAAARGAPAVLVELRERHGRIALLRLQTLQVFGKLAHQIAARNPHRQCKLLRRQRCGHAECDREQVRVQVGGGNAVVDGSAGGVAAGGGGGSSGGRYVGHLGHVRGSLNGWWQGVPPGAFLARPRRWRRAHARRWQRSAWVCR